MLFNNMSFNVSLNLNEVFDRVINYLNKDSPEVIESKARDGDCDAQYYLGLMFYFGNNKGRNHKKAFEYLKESADAGHSEAQYMVGVMYEYAQGVEQNYAQAFDFYIKAAKQGHTEALNWLISKAEAKYGSSKAQCNLGLIYKRGQVDAIGKVINRAYDKALKYFKMAAEQGNSVAQYNLGLMYEAGQVEGGQNLKEAIDWYQKAADRGHKQAERALNRIQSRQ